MKFVHIVGNRPQFIKLAPVYHELNTRKCEQYIIHSGQHYDNNMSAVFFQDLDIPEPYVNLNIGSGTHAEMTAKAMIGIEKELQELHPDVVIVYGDTDTTLAAAIASKKLNITIAHVEGGIRTYNKTNPEENNRIVTDHLSDFIFCSDQFSIECAKKEGLGEIAHLTGDVMYDTYLETSQRIQGEDIEDIVLMTWHRQENTSDKNRMEAILDFIVKLGDTVVCPLHPRTKKCLIDYGLYEKALNINNFKIIEPVGYVEMVSYMKKSRLILTDSGGLSKESSFAGSKCLFMVDLDIWSDLMDIDWIHKFNPEDIVSSEEALDFAKKAKKVSEKDRPLFYGNGRASQIIADLLFKKEV